MKLAIFMLLASSAVAQMMPFPGPGMPVLPSGPKIVSSACAGGISDATTSPVNMTGATFFVVGFSSNTSSPGAVFSDSVNGGGYVNLITDASAPGGPYSFLAYRENSSASSSMTFTVAAAGQYTGFCVVGFSGIVTSGSLQSGTNLVNHGSLTTVAPGAITPGAGKNLIVTSVGDQSAAAWTIDGGFLIPAVIAFGPGNNYAAGIAYLIQTGTASVNPTWSSGSTPSATIAAFTGS